MSNVFTRRREKLLALKSLRSGGPRSAPAPACPACGAEVPRGELHKNLYVCPRCGHHHAVSAYYRLSLVLDPGTFRELDERIWGDIPEKEMEQLYETLLRIERNLE